MLSKFFQSFNEKKDNNEDHSFDSDLYNLIYEIIVADHEITEQEINLASELVEFYFIFHRKKKFEQSSRSRIVLNQIISMSLTTLLNYCN